MSEPEPVPLRVDERLKVREPTSMGLLRLLREIVRSLGGRGQ